MIKKIYLILFLLTTVLFLSNAQKQNSNWFFGYNAGLTWQTTQPFNATGVYGTPNATLTGIPLNVTGSPMTTIEGCFSISDINGNLMFFSDGMTIWDKNKQPMPNGTGLTGNSSSSQSGITFPYPRNRDKYIVVSLGDNASNNLSYSIVDMTLPGNGTVANPLGNIENPKNNLFTGQSGLLGESVAATIHSNKYDYWVVAPGRTLTNSYLNIWKVTSTGVQTARHSVVTVGQPTYPSTAGGYIKFTQDGKHFVWLNFGHGAPASNTTFFCYGDFDNTTGLISNLRVRTGSPLPDAGYGYGYGVDFSPNGKYLYLTYAPTGNAAIVYTGLEVYDFDALLATSTPNTITAVKTIINYPGGIGYHFGAIQTGADERMYIAKIETNSLYVIDNPNDPINMKIYSLDNLLTGTTEWGLPNFAAPWFDMVISPPLPIDDICAEGSCNLELLINNGYGFDKVTSVDINFGDGSPAVNYPPSTVIGGTIQSHIYKVPGTYTITVIAHNSIPANTITETITITVNSCALRVNPNIRGVNKK